MGWGGGSDACAARPAPARWPLPCSAARSGGAGSLGYYRLAVPRRHHYCTYVTYSRLVTFTSSRLHNRAAVPGTGTRTRAPRLLAGRWLWLGLARLRLTPITARTGQCPTRLRQGVRPTRRSPCPPLVGRPRGNVRLCSRSGKSPAPGGCGAGNICDLDRTEGKDDPSSPNSS